MSKINKSADYLSMIEDILRKKISPRDLRQVHELVSPSPQIACLGALCNCPRPGKTVYSRTEGAVYQACSLERPKQCNPFGI